MILPQSVQSCIHTLEASGFSAYVVGGCVRDHLLGLQPHDYDICTGALPEQTEAVFSHCRLVLAGKKHGTVGVVTEDGVVEITTFRTEGPYRDARHPDWVKFLEEVSGDLFRRDFTINAMAWSPERGLQDPFGGEADLKNRVLRAVGDPETRFTEDPLRILRGVRFAVRFHLTPEPETEQAMNRLAPLMESLARERVFDELCKLLPLVSAEDLLRWSGILSAVIPELAPTVGFDQHSPYHAYDLFTHIARTCGAVPPELHLRWAALLHDVGKIPTYTRDETGRGHFYGHAGVSAEMADEILRRLKAPNRLREQVIALIDKHMTRLEPDKKTLKRQLGRLGYDMMHGLLCLQSADMGSKGTGKNDYSDHFGQIRQLLEEIRAEDACLGLKDLAVNGRDLMALGYRGKAIGDALDHLLNLVLEEAVCNEKTALLAALPPAPQEELL